MTRKLEALTGEAIGEPLQMEPQQGSDSPTAMFLPRYIQSLVNSVSAAGHNVPLPAWWSAQTEQLLMTMLLYCNRHNYSHLLEEEAPEATAMEVRRAEDYIEANWREPITLEDLAAVTGVSVLGAVPLLQEIQGLFAARIPRADTAATRRIALVNTARPLDRFPLIRARHVERAREALSKVYSNDMKFEPLERGSVVDITVNNCQLTQTGLNYTGYGAGVRAHFPGSKFVTLSFPTRGSGSIGHRRNREAARSPARPGHAGGRGLCGEPQCRFRTCRLEAGSQGIWRASWRRSSATPVDAPLQFDPLLDFSGTCAHLLRDHFFFLVDMVSTSPVPIPKLLQAEFEQTLMVMFLYATRHRYSRLLDVMWRRSRRRRCAGPRSISRRTGAGRSPWKTSPRSPG